MTPFKYPCNCFGTLGQFELDMEFHEMGCDGCRRIPGEMLRTKILTQENIRNDPALKALAASLSPDAWDAISKILNEELDNPDQVH